MLGRRCLVLFFSLPSPEVRRKNLGEPPLPSRGVIFWVLWWQLCQNLFGGVDGDLSRVSKVCRHRSEYPIGASGNFEIWNQFYLFRSRISYIYQHCATLYLSIFIWIFWSLSLYLNLQLCQNSFDILHFTLATNMTLGDLKR